MSQTQPFGSQIQLQDAGSYYATKNAEFALQQVGAFDSNLVLTSVGNGLDLLFYKPTLGGILVPNSVVRTLRQKLNGRIDVDDFGADPTGGTDSTTKIQNAINAYVNVGTTGSTLDFTPGGNYICGSLTIPTTSNNNNTSGQKSLKLRGNRCTLRGRNTDNAIITTGGTLSPLTYTNGLQIEAFDFDMSLMPNLSTTAGLQINRAYNCQYRDLVFTGAPASSYDIQITENVYLSTFDSVTCGIVKVAGTGFPNDATTLLFNRLSASQVNIRNAFGLTFIMPVIQGSKSAFVLSNAFNITILGGDIEITGAGIAYLDTSSPGASGVNYITSTNNNIALAGGAVYMLGNDSLGCDLKDRNRGSNASAFGTAFHSVNISTAATPTTIVPFLGTVLISGVYQGWAEVKVILGNGNFVMENEVIVYQGQTPIIKSTTNITGSGFPTPTYTMSGANLQVSLNTVPTPVGVDTLVIENQAG